MTNTQSNFRKTLDRLAYSEDYRKVFAGFCRLAACALAAQTREHEYLEEARHWTRDQLAAFSQALAELIQEMEAAPYEDLLGVHYMEAALSPASADRHGEFHTPKPICDLMAHVTVGNFTPTGDTIQILEPCCGAGAMILSTFQAMNPSQRRRARFTAIDINPIACDMAFINTTLWGIPCRIHQGNTLSMEMHHAWTNIHMLMPWLHLFRTAPASPVPAPVASIAPFPPQGEPATPAEVNAIARAIQGEFAF